MSSVDASTPLLEREGPPRPSSAYIREHPIFLRVCHSPYRSISQTALVYIRFGIAFYLTALGFMLSHYKAKHKVHVLSEDGEGGKDGGAEYNNWQIIFQFSTIAFFILWFYHVITVCWSFTHLYYPDIDADDSRWEYCLLKKMSPPIQTIHSRKRFYFSLFYTIVHVFAVLNVILYWAVLVPKGHGHFPTGEPTEESFDEFFGHGWIQPFCIINLWGVTGLIALFEVVALNSIKCPVPVVTHVFCVMFALSCYLGWASFGQVITGEYALFWLDREKMEYMEVVCAYCAGFVGMGPIVFAILYLLICFRDKFTKKEEPVPPQFSIVQFAQDAAAQVAEGIQHAQEEIQRAARSAGRTSSS